MKSAALLGAVLALALNSANAQPISQLRATDLNGHQHHLPEEWREGGVLILGFSHDAHEGMDQWVSALGLEASTSNWLEAPVIGDAAPAIARPMIRSGMSRRYATSARRAHVAPVFEDADRFEQLAGADHDDVAVLVLNSSGEVIARADGSTSAANVTAIQNARAGAVSP